ncbi:stage II sporulation protein R [Bacillus marasmi]|uniref:stage II sporulation protein R n=1 Tax=Bacillus marasmi TaxID=1926279 RepID=UPI0011CBA9EE|nr:stage II sporulation protein R [Bacillus marasmi]
MTKKTKFRRTLITSYLLLLSFATIFSLYMPKNEATAQEETVIPNEAIRLRILANSDSDKDQDLKRKVRDAVNAEITQWVQDLTSLEEARKTIKSGLPEIQKIAEQIVAEENETQTVKVDFGKVNFPTKLYGQFLYPAGEYEAILITLGEGEGANWWCVLFPPLCFLDFSNGVAVSEGFEEEQGDNSKKNPVSKSSETEKNGGKIAQAESVEQTNEDDVTTAPKPEKTETTQATTQAQTEASPITEQPKTQVKQQEEEPIDAEENITPVSEKSKQEKQSEKKAAKKSKKPVYTAQDEEEVEVKFFVVELWTKFF